MYTAQTEGIDKAELDQRKAAQESQPRAGPAHHKAAHQTMDCYRWKSIEQGTAPFPNAEEYQRIKIGADEAEESEDSEVDLYTPDGKSCCWEDSALEESSCKEDSADKGCEDPDSQEKVELENEQEQVSEEKN